MYTKIGKKNWLVSSSSFGRTPDGTKGLNHTDQFRLDIDAQWTAESIEFGPGGLGFQRQNNQNPTTFKGGDIWSSGPESIQIEDPQIIGNGPSFTQRVKISGQFYGSKIEWMNKFKWVNPSKNDEAEDNRDAAVFPSPPTEEERIELRRFFRSNFLDFQHFKMITLGESYESLQGIWSDIADYDIVTRPTFDALIPTLGETYYDGFFTFQAPFDKDEVMAKGAIARPATVDFQANYVFEQRDYEAAIKGSAVAETLLPNMYSYLTADFAKNPSSIPFIDQAGLAKDAGGSWWSYNNYTKGHRHVEDILDKVNADFFGYYAERLSSSQVNPDIKTAVEAKQGNICFTSDNKKFLMDYNDRSRAFPMYNKIEFDAEQKAAGLSALLEQSGQDKTFLKWMVTNMGPAGSTTIQWPPNSHIGIQQTVEMSGGAKGESTTTNTLVDMPMKTADFQWWLDGDFVSSFNQEMVEENSTFVGENFDGALEATTPNNAFYENLLQVIVRGKFSKFVRSKIRTFGEILTGKEAYSEIMMYRIAKHRVDPSGNIAEEPIQNYFVMNADGMDKVQLYDTQVKFGETYQYFVYAYIAVVGQEYSYSNPSTHEVAVGQPKYHLGIDVNLSPRVVIHEVPYYGFSDTETSHLTMWSDPPPAPMVDLYPMIGSPLVKMFLNGSIDKFEAEPVSILDSDYDNYAMVRAYQNKKIDEPLLFESDDNSSSFQVFRIQPDLVTGKVRRPTSYIDFKDSLYAILNADDPQPSAGIFEAMLPNRHYYFCFRAIDSHGNVGLPSPIYEIMLVRETGSELTYPVVKTYRPEDVKPAPTTKPLQKYLFLKAADAQYFIPQNPDADNTTAVGKQITTVGAKEESLFMEGNAEDPAASNVKKFKIRLTSRATGKKIDVNVRFVWKQPKEIVGQPTAETA